MTTTEARRRRKEQRRERAGILPPLDRRRHTVFFCPAFAREVTVWSVRLLKPYRTKTLGPYLRDTWVVAGGCLVFLLTMLVLRYRRIRAEELAGTNAGQGTRPT